ncbi:MAG: protein translocase subunit SecD [Bacteroidales bacterium]|nr:protein translocase subunit SecD [Bacteroidales bacterium]
MNRKLLSRAILIGVLILLAIWQLYPTFNLSRLNKNYDQKITQLQGLAEISIDEINNALLEENLEDVVLKKVKGTENEQQTREIAAEIQKMDEKILNTERKAIKQGLDLQGGSYLVYEVDFPQFLGNISKNPSEEFKAMLTEIDLEARQNDLDFFEVLVTKLQEQGLKLDRYFGKKGESEGKVISELREETEAAIDRSLEVLRNRIDQFGVSEPSITKQGHRRIVVELAGIQDVNRAKAIIGKTAILEFKLLRDADYTRSILLKIDEVVKKRRYGALDSAAMAEVMAPDTTGKDTTLADEKIRDDKEVNLDELFGELPGSSEQAGDDTSLSVDREMFEENPFLALLGNVGNMIAAPTQNIKAVDIVLNYPEVKKIIPEDSEFLWDSKPERYGEKDWCFLYFVKKSAELTGEYIEDADVQISGGGGGAQMSRAGAAEVHFTLNSEGSKKFSRITGANIGKFLAVVLDGKVSNAPRIKSKISGGSAQIDGMENIDEAKDLQVVLQAGALPARLESIEERTVGPSLGKDSIKKGTYSMMLGLLIVIVFMVIYYRLSGFVADLALILNILFIMAVLAAFHATLTLPGIAGIILTIGMAVDANVLVFERIREELRSGKTIRAAIDAGYGRAFTTILDANLTTFLTALVLYQFGTGPIQGFAVTLSIGIAASMFTAIVVTRFVFDYVTSKWEVKSLSI